MKKIFLLFILLIFYNCNRVQSTHPLTEIEIFLQKEIILDIELEASTTYFSKIDSHLLIYDAHVSNRKLICVDVFSGKTAWKIDQAVFNFVTYKNNVVIDFGSYIALHEITTGNEIWRTHVGSINYTNKLGAEVSKDLLIDYNGKKAILNLDEHTIDSVKNNLVSAHYFKTQGGKTEHFITGIVNLLDTNNELITAIVVKNEQGAKKSYFWSLDEENRIFYLVTYNENGGLINLVKWFMDEEKEESTDADYFNGYPEPSKLVNEIYLVNGQLFLYENYTNYRWSWGYGSNRINCIDVETGKINYQKWGHPPNDARYITSKRFHFFDHTLLYADNIMHFQNGDGKYWTVNKNTGEVLDSLEVSNTLFRNYDENHLLGFSYESKQIGESSKYDYAIEMRFLNSKDNTFTRNFRFDYNQDYPYEPVVYADLGIIILSVRKENNNKSIIHIYKIEK